MNLPEAVAGRFLPRLLSGYRQRQKLKKKVE
jgi:hypothetical protein